MASRIKNSPDCQERGGEEVKLQKWIFWGAGEGSGQLLEHEVANLKEVL